MARVTLEDQRRSRELDARLRAKLGLPPAEQTRYRMPDVVIEDDGISPRLRTDHWERKTRRRPNNG